MNWRYFPTSRAVQWRTCSGGMESLQGRALSFNIWRMRGFIGDFDFVNFRDFVSRLCSHLRRESNERAISDLMFPASSLSCLGTPVRPQSSRAAESSLKSSIVVLMPEHIDISRGLAVQFKSYHDHFSKHPGASKKNYGRGGSEIVQPALRQLNSL